MKMRLAAGLAATVLASSAFAQCQPLGWRLVSDKLISVTERACVYEKNGTRVQIIVGGFCPMSPC